MHGFVTVTLHYTAPPRHLRMFQVRSRPIDVSAGTSGFARPRTVHACVTRKPAPCDPCLEGRGCSNRHSPVFERCKSVIHLQDQGGLPDQVIRCAITCPSCKAPSANSSLCMQMAMIWIFWSSRTGQQRSCMQPGSYCREEAPFLCQPSPAQARQASVQ